MLLHNWAIIPYNFKFLNNSLNSLGQHVNTEYSLDIVEDRMSSATDK